MTTAPSHVIATPGFATMVSAAPVPERSSAAATVGRWFVTALEILFVGVLVPVAILAVGAPIALLAQAIISVATRLLG